MGSVQPLSIESILDYGPNCSELILASGRSLFVPAPREHIIAGLMDLIAKLQAPGVIGDNVLAGQEEALKTYQDVLLINGDAGDVIRKPGLRVGYQPQKLAMDSALPLTVRRFLTRLKTRSVGTTQALRQYTAQGFE